MYKKKLSIIIPVYDAEKYIEECIQSVLCQMDDSMELIIVNDGSTDLSGQICQRYAEKYNFIKYIKKRNEGVSSARNIAMQYVEGEWVFFLDADDMLQNNVLQYIGAYLKDCDVILCDYSNKKNCIDIENEINISSVEVELLRKAILNLPSYHKRIKEQGYFIDSICNWACWGKFYKTELLRKNNIYFSEELKYGEDLVFCYQAYSYAKNIQCIPIKLYYYRMNDYSLSRRFNKNRIENTIRLLDNMTLIGKKNEKDMIFFVIDRLIACCELYFGAKENRQSIREKTKELEKLIQYPCIENAVEKCPITRLSMGKKKNILCICILSLLKRKFYFLAIIVSKLI